MHKVVPWRCLPYLVLSQRFNLFLKLYFISELVSPFQLNANDLLYCVVYKSDLINHEIYI
jgi:hypothetical protein